jgi:hypothetical protein
VTTLDVSYGSKCEELEPSISGPVLPSKADVRADVPVGRVRAKTGHYRKCGTPLIDHFVGAQ